MVCSCVPAYIEATPLQWCDTQETNATPMSQKPAKWPQQWPRLILLAYRITLHLCKVDYPGFRPRVPTEVAPHAMNEYGTACQWKRPPTVAM